MPNFGTQNKAPYKITEITENLSWVLWQGQWGEESKSPRSPGSQGVKWTNPLEWSQSPTLSNIAGVTGSPVHLHAYDSNRHHVGLNEWGEIESEILGTYLYQPSNGNGQELIAIVTDDNITFEIKSTLTGQADKSHFDFAIGQYLKSENKKIVVTYEKVQIIKGTIAYLPINPTTNPKYILYVDVFGDNKTIVKQLPTAVILDWKTSDNSTWLNRLIR